MPLFEEFGRDRLTIPLCLPQGYLPLLCSLQPCPQSLIFELLEIGREVTLHEFSSPCQTDKLVLLLLCLFEGLDLAIAPAVAAPNAPPVGPEPQVPIEGPREVHTHQLQQLLPLVRRSC